MCQKVDGKIIFTDYWKVLVLIFSVMGNMVFFDSRSWWKRWYLLITEKFLFWTFRWWEIRSFFESRIWWKDDIYWLPRSSCSELFDDGKYYLFLSQKVDGKMTFTLSFWDFYHIPGHGKYDFSCSVDKTIFDCEISFPNHSLIRTDRNRKGGDIAFFIRSDICFNSQNYLFDKNTSFDLLLPKTKPFSFVIVYKPSNDNHFLYYLSKGLNDFNLMENDIFILGNTNTNTFNNGENILDKYKDMSKRKSNFGAIPQKYPQICLTLGLKQLIKHSIRITCYTWTLIDHIITSYEEKVTQSGVMNTSLSDHQLIFCTRNIKRVKTNNHKQVSFRSLKNYSMQIFERELKTIALPNYEKFSDVNSAYSDIVNKITQAINNFAPYKTIRVKNQSNEGFDGELAGQISNNDKLLKSSKKANFTSTSWYIKKPKAQFYTFFYKQSKI